MRIQVPMGLPTLVSSTWVGQEGTGLAGNTQAGIHTIIVRIHRVVQPGTQHSSEQAHGKTTPLALDLAPLHSAIRHDDSPQLS